ncbi:uncharacterized protein LOC111319236 [Stylophora pistillata]|uniref:uncharacterized protein LOC111319236 n=1 Tax=Stylophora pistillata TaxID=50429 RepID=UPI000C0440FF|nr:uncharacterized protein LOC111319236 [Stylophora pistillata]
MTRILCSDWLLISLEISPKRGRGDAEVSTNYNESELILNRAGRIGKLREDDKDTLFVEFKEIVPIGAAICTSCRLEHCKKRERSETEVIDFDVHLDKSMEQDSVECEVTVIEEDQPLHEDADETLLSQASQISGPEKEVSIWCDEKEIQNQRRQALNDALGNLTSGRFSPILSTLNASWDNISPTQQKDYIRKGRGAVAVALSVISPGKGKDLWKCIQNDLDIIERNESSSSKRKHFDTNTGLIDVLIKAHDQEESWQTKRQILSLFANDFSRRELQTLIPGLTKWRIDQARQHATEAGCSRTNNLPKKNRSGKVDHFISYISQPQLHQDVAFGTKTLKLDSGERITIPAVVRTLIPSRIIEQYTS